MNNLENLIILAKNNDENAMLEIIEKFRPVINKYFKKSYYNEDIKSALELKLIEVVKLELKLNKMRNCNEGAIINYITVSLYHHYLEISNNNKIKSKLEFIYEENFIFNLLDSNELSFEKNIEDNIIFELLQKILTKREFKCIYYIVFVGYTVEELAKKWSITKQACNQRKLRAFKKISKYFENNQL